MAGGDLKALRDRLRAATGPDRDLDTAVGEALEVPSATGVEVDSVFWEAQRVTASIDAALALVERTLPAANTVGFERNPHGCDAYVSRNYVNDKSHFYFSADDRPTVPLAILIALVDAMIGKETGDA